MQDLYDTARGMTETFCAHKKADEEAKRHALFEYIRDTVPERVIRAAKNGETSTGLLLGHF